MTSQILVMAKTPAPGRVKTRLCPPFTPEQAARLAAAALADTMAAVAATPVTGRVLVVDGDLEAPTGWDRVTQRGHLLAERLTHAYTDTAVPRRASLLIGMDTPQAGPELLGAAVATLAGEGVDAVLGLAEDGGWWALGLNDPAHADVLRDIPTSTDETGVRTRAALIARGLRVAALPVLTDVDTVSDARTVASLCPAGSAFAAALNRTLPA